jgi:hypothetical protein
MTEKYERNSVVLADGIAAVKGDGRIERSSHSQ